MLYPGLGRTALAITLSLLTCVASGQCADARVPTSSVIASGIIRATSNAEIVEELERMSAGAIEDSYPIIHTLRYCNDIQENAERMQALINRDSFWAYAAMVSKIASEAVTAEPKDRSQMIQGLATFAGDFGASGGYGNSLLAFMTLEGCALLTKDGLLKGHLAPDEAADITKRIEETVAKLRPKYLAALEREYGVGFPQEVQREEAFVDALRSVYPILLKATNREALTADLEGKRFMDVLLGHMKAVHLREFVTTPDPESSLFVPLLAVTYMEALRALTAYVKEHGLPIEADNIPKFVNRMKLLLPESARKAGVDSLDVFFVVQRIPLAAWRSLLVP